MDLLVVAAAVSVILPGIGAVAWLARLEGRVSNQETVSTLREQYALIRHQETLDRFDRIEQLVANSKSNN